MKQMPRFKLRQLPVAVCVILLSGCATFSEDGGFGTVSELTEQRTGQPVTRPASADGANANAERVSALLTQALDPNTTVQIALLNNRGLQASFAELGVAEADYVQAGRMRNPNFSFQHLRSGESLEIDRSVTFDLIGLLTIPLRSGILQGRFEQAKLQAASTAVQLVADARRAYFEAVAARQTAAYMEQVQNAAQASAELAARMAKVGNWSKLEQARQQAFYADATVQVARARQNAVATREQLTRLLGLWGKDIAFTLPDRLPDLPRSATEITDLESQAITQRLDIHMAKRDADATAKALGLTKASGFINVLDAGYANKSQSGSPRENGYQVSLELPIFDWGGARTAKAEALYMQAVHRTADTAIRARSEVREAYSAYRTSYDVAKHYRDEVVPLRRKISDEVLLRYNGMLISVFELLTDAREQANSVNTAIEAQRDFWLADTRLQGAISGAGSDAALTRRMTPAAASAAQNKH
jgi:outer membrane protein TolC